MRFLSSARSLLDESLPSQSLVLRYSERAVGKRKARALVVFSQQKWLIWASEATLTGSEFAPFFNRCILAAAQADTKARPPFFTEPSSNE